MKKRRTRSSAVDGVGNGEIDKVNNKPENGEPNTRFVDHAFKKNNNNNDDQEPPIVTRKLRSSDSFGNSFRNKSSDTSLKRINTSQDSSISNSHRKVKRIKLNFRAPPPTITHPDHVTRRSFPNLTEYLGSFKSFLDDDLSLEEYTSKVGDEIQLIKKIRNAINNQVLQIDPYTSKIIKHPKHKPPVDPFVTLPTTHDHLIAQGVKMSKIFHDQSRARINRTKKINSMVENYFKKLAGEKDREIRDHEKRMKKMARDTVTMVKRRWREVEKAYKIIVDKKRELEKIEEGKKTMNRMVLDSSLKAVGHAISGKAPSQEPESDSEVESDVDDSEIEEREDANSNVDLKPDNDDDDDDDSKLTQEELKKKYAFLDSYEMANNDKTNEEDDEKEIEEDGQGEKDIVVTEEDIERYKALDNDDHNSMLDSDESLSDSEEESDSDNETDSEDEAEDNGGGLASLFGDVINKDESDDDEVENYEDEEVKIGEDEDDHGSITEIEGVKSPLPKIEEVDDEDMRKKQTRTDDSDGIANSDDENEMNIVLADEKTKDEKPPKQEPLKEEISKEDDGSATIPDVPVPSLLRGTLRAYQKQGLNWLANLYNNNTNGILADEMGLGKTIQTISLISYLACEKQIWGPHLIVVPTSVMLNWEMEFKRFAPGFKVLTYYGNPQQRKEKRKGWNKADAFHVCITSYQLVLHDHQSFRRRRWEYMILDEAHNIKNFRTARWQALLNFNTNRRLLLTGTPLQNNLAELWSLLYFLMPSAKNVSNMPEGFASLDDFQQWFGRPVDKIIEGGSYEQDRETKETISKLHKVLRPYLLRRLKADVEKQMPLKYEHIIYCRLSKRQRFLYDDFMSRAQTKETLASGNFLSIINCLMQLRKVCNHPDLFEVRPILTSFAIENSIPGKFQKKLPSVVADVLKREINMDLLGYIFTNNEMNLTTSNSNSINKLNARKFLMKECQKLEELIANPIDSNYNDIGDFYKYYKYVEQKDALDHSRQTIYINDFRCSQKPVFGSNLLNLLHVDTFFNDTKYYLKKDNHILDDMIKPLSTRILSVKNSINSYAFVTPPIVTLDYKNQLIPEYVTERILEADPDVFSENSLHQPQMKLSIQFPDKNLLLYDSGKLQKLAKLLYDLKVNGHRALIFTQMTKVLDILEKFLNGLGYLYMRLDGATKIEDRQLLTEKFNRDPRITCFILSTRSGGLGINLTGADTVIFYDNDWNPAMDKQCQDRCHRIGQTRDVHIYRFVSEYTIEENIMRKSNYKRKLDNVVIQDGDFTTDYFGKLTLSDILGTESADGSKLLMGDGNIDSLAQAEDAEDAAAAKEAIKESELDVEDFDENASTAQSNNVQTNNNDKSKTGSPAVVASSDKSAIETPLMDTADENVDEGEVKEGDVDVDDEDEDDGMGHVDEYMLRFIEDGYYY
ncbi:chromatin-remodeling protein [Saccharomycopsis crataegensis]|uniref:Helicase SWR1 n=1 Tax=Saccharomycopsis crataegensis TaxID=43959 RepID=A0AAV5QNX5_9ASCO|nr:chromatin-remodeling protein [Saccharomycopsis crataegensis]